VITNYLVFGIAQIWLRDLLDFVHAVTGTAASLALSTLFQVSIKFLIGGVRPNFLDICKPNLEGVPGQGYGGAYYDRAVCTGDKREVDDGFESFPSGHSNAAFAGLLFLSLYLNAKLKLWSQIRGSGVVWKVFAVAVPVWGACVLSLTRLVDYTHNWYDILAGAVIGIFFAFACYRSYYRSIFDSRYNHIPLTDDDVQIRYDITKEGVASI